MCGSFFTFISLVIRTSKPFSSQVCGNDLADKYFRGICVDLRISCISFAQLCKESGVLNITVSYLVCDDGSVQNVRIPCSKLSHSFLWKCVHWMSRFNVILFSNFRSDWCKTHYVRSFLRSKMILFHHSSQFNWRFLRSFLQLTLTTHINYTA